jgi:neopullulanase
MRWLGIKCVLSFCCFFFNINPISAQKAPTIAERVDPPFWYQELGSDTLQLLFYGNEIQQAELLSKDVQIKVLNKVGGIASNYLIYNVLIPTDFVGTLPLSLVKGKQQQAINYEIKPLIKSKQAITASDVMYLVMPDRFANGDVKNDNIIGYKDTWNRSAPKARHGGDIKGMIDHFDYFKELGITSLWLNPLIENNQPVESYHGYAATDFYTIDARFGSNADYQKLANKCQQENIKLVMDVVYNHCGNEHPFYKELISPNWFHLFDTFTKSNYRGAAMVDIYASEKDKMLMSNGWFDKHMPDINQQDENFKRYLIQNTLWWIAYAQLSGVRIDTYPYPDLDFMNALVGAIKANFPKVFVFGETWEHGEPLQAYFAKNNIANTHNSQLDGVTDFQLYFAINKALNEDFGWTDGLSKLYYVLAKDYLYQQPNNLVTFADNHDLDRIFSVLGNDLNKQKMAIGFILTTRGIPCVYYGTELLMNDRGDHGLLRRDMPGGWQGDTVNIFITDGRNLQQKEMFEFIKTLNLYRTSNPALFNDGKRIQFIPEKGTYVYFIENADKVLGVFMNQNKVITSIETARFEELKLNKVGLNVLTKKEQPWQNQLEIPAEGILIIEFKK